MARVFRRAWTSPDGAKRTSPWYSLDFEDPANGRRAIRQTHPLTSSKRIATEQLHAALVGPGKGGGGPTAAKVLDRYGDYLSTHHLTTWHSCGGRVRWWEKKLGATPAEAVTPADLEAAMATLPVALREATRAGYLVIVTAAFRRAIRDRLIRNDPTIGVGLKFGYPERDALWTDQELAAVVAVAPRWLGTLLRFLRYQGIRIGDALQLRWEDVKDGRLRLRMQKSRDLLDVPVSARAVAVLAEIGEGKGLVWPGPTGRPRAYNRVLRSVQEAMRQADPPVVGRTIHDLRRSLATELLERGESLELIAALLGQKSTRVAGRYAKVRFEALRRALDRFAVLLP
jgi:integrase